MVTKITFVILFSYFVIWVSDLENSFSFWLKALLQRSHLLFCSWTHLMCFLRLLLTMWQRFSPNRNLKIHIKCVHDEKYFAILVKIRHLNKNIVFSWCQHVLVFHFLFLPTWWCQLVSCFLFPASPLALVFTIFYYKI